MFGRRRREPEPAAPPVEEPPACVAPEAPPAPPAPDPLAEARAAGFLGYSGFGTIYGELTAELPFNHCDAQVFGTVNVGAFTYCNYGGEIRDATIGRYCSIGQRVIINPSGHPTGGLSTHPFVVPYGAAASGMGDVEAFRAIVADVADVGHAQRVTIGPDVWIGASAAIMPGITIGTGAIIGAAAVVTHDVAPYSVVVGAPARHLRFRLRDGLLERVLASEWWLWDLRGIPGHRDYRDPAAFLERFLAARDSGLLERLRPAVVTVRDRTLHGIVADGEGNVPDPVSMII